MDVDKNLLNPNLINQENPESSQLSLMDEDSEGFELGELDLPGLEDACIRKDFDNIKPSQIDTLEVVLSKAQQHKKLGIQPGSHWDGLKSIKESKKRGRKLDWLRTIMLGEMLVESGRYPKLTRFYKQLPSTSS